MVRQFDDVFIQVVDVKFFHCLDDADVQAHAAPRGEFLGECLLDQGVGELVAFIWTRRHPDHACNDRLFCDVQQRVFGEFLAQRRE